MAPRSLPQAARYIVNSDSAHVMCAIGPASDTKRMRDATREMMILALLNSLSKSSSALGIAIEDAGAGLWRFGDEPPEAARPSEPPEYWAGR